MKIAIIKLSSLGDIVHTMVVLQFIKKKYPDSKIDWIVDNKFKEILIHNSHINKIHTVNINAAKKNKSLRSFIREIYSVKSLGNYDVAIDFQGLIKSALISKLLNSKKVVGFDRQSAREGIASLAYNQHVNIGYDKNSVIRNVKLASEALNINIKKDDLINKDLFLFSESEMINKNSSYILLVAGSTWPSRNYPKEKYVEVANALKTKCLVIWGNEEERQNANWMERESAYINVMPKLSLDELKFVVSKASLVIGNDTGPSHMSWALNIPSIVLFGPTPVQRMFQTSLNKAIKSKSKINHMKLNKKDFSIKEIGVNEIVKIANQLLRVK